MLTVNFKSIAMIERVFDILYRESVDGRYDYYRSDLQSLLDKVLFLFSLSLSLPTFGTAICFSERPLTLIIVLSRCIYLCMILL